MYFCNCHELKNLNTLTMRKSEICPRCQHYCFWQEVEPGRTKPKRKRICKPGGYKKVKLALTALIALMAVSCASSNDLVQDSPMFNAIDPQLQVYFNYFSEQTGVPDGSITAGFVSLPPTIAGECIWGGAWNEVRIDPDKWANYNWTEAQKQQLVSHELGHCALFLNHINNCSDGTTAPDGTLSSCNLGQSMPLSIMNWQMFDADQAASIGQNYYDFLLLNKPIN